MSVSEETLTKIKSENLNPKSAISLGFFKFLGYFLMAAGITFIILVFGIVIFNIIESNELVGLILAPVLVLSVFAAFVFIILFQKGASSDDFYKIAHFKFAGFLLGLLLSGTLLWNLSGAAKAADLALQENKQYCQTMKKAVYVKWSSPEKGFLAGEVEEKPVSPRTFTLKDLKRHIWTIQPVETLSVDFLESGHKVKLQGEVIDTSVFRAREMDLWEGRMWFDIMDEYYSDAE